MQNEKLKKYLQEILGPTIAKEIIKAIQSRRPIVIGGCSGPTGKTTLCRILRENGAIVYEEYETPLKVNLLTPLKERKPNFSL